MWLINDTFLENSNSESLNAEVDSFVGRGRLRLFNITPSLNMTVIKCRVELESEEIETSTNGTLLLIQGQLFISDVAITWMYCDGANDASIPTSGACLKIFSRIPLHFLLSFLPLFWLAQPLTIL